MFLKVTLVFTLGLCAMITGHHGHDDHHDDHPADSHNKKVVQIEVGEFCDLASAPDSKEGTSWSTVEQDVEKICALGSTCINGACNCNDLADGTLMGISQDNNGGRICRRLAGQKCSSDDECFKNVLCSKGVCTCPQDVHCQTTKNDVYILD